MASHWYLITDINPEPWAIGNLSVIRGRGSGKPIPIVGPNAKLAMFKEALADEMKRQYPDEITMMEGDLRIEFHFWRSSDHGNVADATNLQKATEDALQGVLYENDRSTRHISSHIVEQTPTTRPAIGILIDTYTPLRSIKWMEDQIKERTQAGAFEGVEWKPSDKDYF